MTRPDSHRATHADWLAFLKINLKVDLCIGLVLVVAAIFGGHH